MISNIELLIAPIRPNAATGCNIREDAAATPLYFKLKDARSAARLYERQAESEIERPALAPEWRIVSELSQTILRDISKDIEVAAWLVEASIRLEGFAGLRSAMTVLHELVARYWDDLHSIDSEDLGTKVAPVAGLNGSGADGSLIQPMRLAPLTSPSSGEAAGLWHYMVMRKRGPAAPEAVALKAAVRNSAPDALIEIFQNIDLALSEYGKLVALLDEHCGEDAPQSSAIRGVLEDAKDAMRDVAADALAGLGKVAERTVTAAPAEPPPDVAEQAPVNESKSDGLPQPLRSRDDALRELSRIAMFFREHEPNAPTAYSLETLIRRARIPLMDLLAELIPDEANRQIYLDRAGIRPD